MRFWILSFVAVSGLAVLSLRGNDIRPSLTEEVSPVIALVRRWEGCRLDSYLCPAGRWTIGYGHTRDVQEGMSISQEEAEQMLEADLDWMRDMVRCHVLVPINRNQEAALVSFVYNVGETAFKKSTMLRKLNGKDYDGAADEFGRWIYAGGKPMDGLRNRRMDEEKLFMRKP